MQRSFGQSPACEMGMGTVRAFLTLYAWQSLRCRHVGCPINSAEWELHMPSFTGSTRDQRAGLGPVLAATRNTSLYSDQPLLFACLLSWLAPQSPISVRQSPQLDNGSDVVLPRSNGHKAGSYFLKELKGRIHGDSLSPTTQALRLHRSGWQLLRPTPRRGLKRYLVKRLESLGHSVTLQPRIA